MKNFRLAALTLAIALGILAQSPADAGILVHPAQMQTKAADSILKTGNGGPQIHADAPMRPN